MKDTALFILKEDRGDLIEFWFKSHREQIGKLKERAQVSAFSGIAGGITPNSLQNEISLLRMQATYNHFLASDAWEKRKPELISKNILCAESVPVIEKMLSEMIDDINEIAKLYDLTDGLIIKAKEFFNPVTS